MKKATDHKINWKNSFLFLIVIFSAFVMMSCAEQTTEVVENPDGFLKGLLHGFIILFSFIGSLFADFEIYSFPNNGFWYDLGFIIGASAFFGGSGAGSHKRRKSKRSYSCSD